MIFSKLTVVVETLYYHFAQFIVGDSVFGFLVKCLGSFCWHKEGVVLVVGQLHSRICVDL